MNGPLHLRCKGLKQNEREDQFEASIAFIIFRRNSA